MSAMKRIRIGTRRSRLAMAQACAVADALRAAHDGLEVELVPILTRGDRAGGTLAKAGGKALFVEEIEAALRKGAIDLAVHSAKDVPSDMPEEFAVVAVPPRADAADALVRPGGGPIEDLPPGSAVGTGSLRRRAQLLALSRGLDVVPIRGNVETRLAKLFPGRPAHAAAGNGGPESPCRRLDAVVLAMAGLIRTQLAGEYRQHICRLEVQRFIPAAGQGALLVQSLAGNRAALELASVINDPPSFQAVWAERKVLRALGADCHGCIAIHVHPEGRLWQGLGMAARPDGSGLVRVAAVAGQADQAAQMLLDEFRRLKADDLLRS
jgi:hydroxymethylbilane synthase